MDWGEAQSQFRVGQGDVLTLLGRTPEREAHYEFTQPTLPFAFALFIRTTDEAKFVGIPVADAFRGRKIGVTRAGIARSVLEGEIPEAELIPVDNLLDGTRRLVNREIDAFAGQVWSQSYLISELGLRGLMSLPPFIEGRSNMAVRKGNTALQADLDKALTQIVESGELDRIVEQWSSTRLRLVPESTIIAVTAAASAIVMAALLLTLGLGWSRRQKAALQREVEERRRVEQALRENQLALQAADESKDRFIAMLAHELRNPLAPITTALQLLQRQASESAESRLARDVIGRQTLHLTRLIDDLMDIGRITSGKLELRMGPTLLSEVLEEAVEISRPVIERAGHELRINQPAEAVWVNVDGTRLVQVVMNLLTNAAKYSPTRGPIDIWVEANGADVTIGVRDRGVGIPSEQLNRVFEMFHQESRARLHSQGGLGIGLWLTRKLVELHGGSIAASSAGEGQGAEFVVSLPGTRCQAPQRAA
jgi:signal transduction histidine kinase